MNKQYDSKNLVKTMMTWRALLGLLTPREQKIIEFRFGFSIQDIKTLEETGKAFGVTRERIRQIESKSLMKLEFFADDLTNTKNKQNN